MSDFNSLVQYTVENISRPVKYIIYKLTEFIRVVDKFIFRQVPTGAASGYANIEKVEGNTVVFNQLVQNGDFSNGQTPWTVYYSSISIGDNIATITSTSNDLSARIQQLITAVLGHKYICSFELWGTTTGTAQCGVGGSGDGGLSTITYTTSRTTYKLISAPSTLNLAIFQIRYNREEVSGRVIYLSNINVIDLTAIFGSGNEPTTVADFEAWLAQNIGTLPYYDYNAGELLSVKMSGMQTEDSSQQTLDTIALDVTTITGINTATNVREVMFSSGMKQADREGTIKDTLDLRSDTATVKVGSRAYQSGDESDTTVITDGTTTYYALTTPITYTDLQDANGNPLNPRYKVEQGGTEQVLPTNTSTPTTVAPTLTTVYTKDNN